jgi:hypothetical protein
MGTVSKNKQVNDARRNIQTGSSTTLSIVMASLGSVTTVDFAAGSAGVEGCRGSAAAVGTASHPDRQAAANGTTRVIG